MQKSTSSGFSARVNNNFAKFRQSLSPAISLTTNSAFLAVWVPQFLVFFVLLLLYTYGFMAVPSICVVLSAFCLMVAASLAVFRKQANVLLPLSMMLPMAVLVGSMAGLYTYDVYAIYPMFYANARIYADLVPSTTAAAVSDGGKLVFSSSSYVDTALSVGYITERGNTYCAAPVRYPAQGKQIQFWAVGIDCCSTAGEFTCDSAQDSKAKAGIVMFDNVGYFSSSSFDEYNKAKLKAEAYYSLFSTENPGYVRWVTEDNLDMVSNEYRLKTLGSLAAWFFIYGGISGGIAYLLYKPKKQKPLGKPAGLAGAAAAAPSAGTFDKA